MSTNIERTGIPFVLSSPSGAGKSTLSRRLLAVDSLFELSISATTRAARPGEINGQDYVFMDKKQFHEMVDKGEMLEHANVFGNLYGTPRAPVETALAAGRDVLFDVDWQGAQQLRQTLGETSLVSVFILPPSIADLEKRLRGRAQDSEEVILNRMAKARDEISHWPEYDYVLINDDLDRCYSQIETIIGAERLRAHRQKSLLLRIGALNREFEER